MSQAHMQEFCRIDSAAWRTMQSEATDTLDLSAIFGNNQQPNIDDFVEFEVYFDDFRNAVVSLDVAPTDDDSASAQRREDVTVRAALLSRLCSLYDSLLPFVARYSWTCSPFFLNIKLTPGQPPCLAGRLRVGDNFQEEWLVAELLHFVSDTFPDVSITVRDADGQFLLIEGAANVPSWLTPETATNRVFLRGGTLCILPQQLPSSAPISGIVDVASVFSRSGVSGTVESITLSDALRTLRADPFGTYAARPGLQKTIMRRLRLFTQVKSYWCQSQNLRIPKTLSEAFICAPHRCHIVVPTSIAAALQTYPHLLGTALDHLPPPVDLMRQYADLVKSKQDACPMFDCSDETTVTTRVSVVFNRCQFARFSQLRFRSPAQFTVARWKIPGEAGECPGRESKKRFLPSRQAMERGAKVCLGLLSAYVADTGNTSALLSFFWDKDSTTSKAAATLKRFATLLVEVDGNTNAHDVEKTQEHISDVLDLFEKTSRADCRALPTFRHTLRHVLKKGILSSAESITSDDEGWTCLAHEEVEAIIAERQKEDLLRKLIRDELHKGKASKHHKLPASEDQELHEMFCKFQSFLNVSSDFEGVSLPCDEKRAYHASQLSKDARDRLRQRLPEDLAEMLDDYTEDSSDAGIESNSSEEGESEDKSDGQQNLKLDEDMEELLRAMDAELSSFNTKLQRSKLTIPEDVEEIDDESEGEADPCDPVKPFRDATPADLSERELADLLASNLAKSMKQETFMEPGPASMLFKTLDQNK